MSTIFPKSVPISGRVRVCWELLKDSRIKNKKIVDIGSSFGWLEKEILKEKPKEVIGLEINKEAVDFAIKNVKGAIFIEAGALDLPIKSNYADIVTFFDVIEHIPINTENVALKEINRILKKGGILLLSTPNDHLLSKLLDLAWYFGHRHYNKEKLKKMLNKTGFKIASIESRGSIFSSLYLCWFYIMKRLTGNNQPRNSFIEKLDDDGYKNLGITDVFVIAKKI